MSKNVAAAGMPSVALANGDILPALGEGTWYLGESSERYEAERESLIAGYEAGLTLIDTAEMYGEGAAERLVGDALHRLLAERSRDELFLVSKVYPWNAGRDRIFESCRASLDRLGVDQLDLYLHH